MAAGWVNEHKSPVERLEAICRTALHVSSKARKHRQNLAGNSFNGNKLAELRADATNAFRDLTSDSPGDISAAAELIQTVFAAASNKKQRIRASQELLFLLRTSYRGQRRAPQTQAFFPQSILAQAERGYLVTIGRQMNGCFAEGWFDACAVMMRRLLEISIIEAFEAKNIGSRIKDGSGDYLMLTDLISAAISEPGWHLSRNAKKALPKLKDAGHMSAHGRYFLARREDMEWLQGPCRIVIEEFLHLAGLLKP